MLIYRVPKLVIDRMDERPETRSDAIMKDSLIPYSKAEVDGMQDEQEEEIPYDQSKHLTDEIMLNIFSNLDKKTLMKAAQVCNRWNEIARDKTLWKVISLYPTSFKLTEDRFLTLCKYRLQHTEKLHICNTHVSIQMFRALSKHCASLQTLLFGKQCTFESRSKRKTVAFPKGVSTFDMRLAAGGFDALTHVKGDLDSIHHLGVGPHSFEKMNLMIFLNKIPNLKFVDFTNCVEICDNAVKHLSESCPNLESLCLIGCVKVKGENFQTLLNNCPKLTTLLLRYLRIGDDILSQNFWRESNLTEVDISACPNISHQGLYAFLKQLHRLEYLNMSYCGEGVAVTDDVLYEMAEIKTITKLKMLDIRWSFQISIRGLERLLQKCANLHHLGIYQSFQVTARNMSDLLAYLPRLRIFEFGNSSCQELSKSLLLEKLISSAPNIRELSLINFKGNEQQKEMESMSEFFTRASTLRRFNFCDCSEQLVAVARLAVHHGGGGHSRKYPLNITTKWECALPPPNNTIDRVILQ